MRTPSKINLVLNVTAERENGYHDLDTVFFPLDVPSDAVTIDFLNGEGRLILTCSHPDVPLSPEKNLCGKAVCAYCEAAGLPLPHAVIHIEKHIPCTGGMGGGSSDAAAVLRLMQKQYSLLDDRALAAAAVKIGADVPFFLDPHPSRASGVGEKLTPLPDMPTGLPVLLAVPDFPTSAKWAYDHWTTDDILPSDTTDNMLDAMRQRDLVRAARYMKNSLAPALFRKFPVLTWLRESFVSHGALCAEISGSGPSMFALFADFASAVKAKCALEKEFSSVHFLCGFPEK